MRGIRISQLSSQPYALSEPKTSTIWGRELSFGKAWPARERQRFYQQLGVLLEAGLNLSHGLEILTEQAVHKGSRRIASDLKEALETGCSLSEAAGKQPFFSAFELQSLHMAEQSGRMAPVLQDLGLLYGQRLRIRRKLISALTYPVSVVLIAGLVLAFMMLKVVPMFAGIFEQFDAPLPPLTQVMLDLSAGFRSKGAWWLLAALGAVAAGFFLQKQPGVRQLGERLLMRLPFLGPLLLKLHLARLSYNLSQMLRSQVTLDQALEIQSGMTALDSLASALVHVREEVVQGATLYEAFGKQELFPSFFVQIIRVGEKSARLDTMLEKLAESLEEEASAGIGQLTQMLEPLLIIGLGAGVALILAAMYLPMFELSSVF